MAITTRGTRLLAAALGLVAAACADAAPLGNPGFEIEFGLHEHQNVWGDLGVSFGETYQVYAGTDAHPRKAQEGSRVLLINAMPYQWNGIWQQIPWAENAPFRWHAYYQIQGGDLPKDVSTFMKAEFYDAAGNHLSAVEGPRRHRDTKGKWVRDEQSGVTPPGTASLRFVLIAGDGSEGKMIVNRIYWDAAGLD